MRTARSQDSSEQFRGHIATITAMIVQHCLMGDDDDHDDNNDDDGSDGASECEYDHDEGRR